MELRPKLPFLLERKSVRFNKEKKIQLKDYPLWFCSSRREHEPEVILFTRMPSGRGGYIWKIDWFDIRGLSH